MLFFGLSVRLVICCHGNSVPELFCPYVLTETAAGHYQCRRYGLRCRTYTQAYHDATTPLVCAPLLYRAAAMLLRPPPLLPALLLLLLRYYCILLVPLRTLWMSLLL